MVVGTCRHIVPTWLPDDYLRGRLLLAPRRDMVASTEAYLISYGLRPQGLCGLGINIIVLYSSAGGDLVYHEVLNDCKYPK